jgi:hypothetical protein
MSLILILALLAAPVVARVAVWFEERGGST